MPDIVHICYPGVGGQAAVAMGLAVEAAKSGHSVAVVFYGVEQAAPQHLAQCDSHGITTAAIVKQPGIGLRARKRLRDVLNSYDPQVVIAHHHDMCVTAAMASAGQLIFVEHHSNALKTVKDWLLGSLAHRMSKHTVYLTESYREVVLDKLGWLLQSRKTSVIANGLNLEQYPVVAPAGQVRKLGMQGRMDSGKDFKTLIDALVQLDDPGMTLELIGDGPDRVHLEAYVNGLGIEHQVTFTGFLTQQQLINRMREWDIAILSTDGETMSMAVLEAWALGIPLVASDVPGVQDLVLNHTDACLFKARSAADLAVALRSLSDDLAHRSALSQAGRQRVENEYDLRVVWGKYQQLIDQLGSAVEQTEQVASEQSLTS